LQRDDAWTIANDVPSEESNAIRSRWNRERKGELRKVLLDVLLKREKHAGIWPEQDF